MEECTEYSVSMRTHPKISSSGHFMTFTVFNMNTVIKSDNIP